LQGGGEIEATQISKTNDIDVELPIEVMGKGREE
jgi:hypothetical protein